MAQKITGKIREIILGCNLCGPPLRKQLRDVARLIKVQQTCPTSILMNHTAKAVTRRPCLSPRWSQAPGTLDRLVDTARGYARQATAENTSLAYKTGWTPFKSWCRRRPCPV
ncbi:hypothetical protein [Roseovarius sp. M141]|uniref:hypothetical protein n=1 Tax=Roseovarius sp. M141 TaxID=2583806 RepID=UPI0020CBD161|nr:hypothetical protein [Roseovarius sp. M141]